MLCHDNESVPTYEETATAPMHPKGLKIAATESRAAGGFGMINFVNGS